MTTAIIRIFKSLTLIGAIATLSACSKGDIYYSVDGYITADSLNGQFAYIYDWATNAFIDSVRVMDRTYHFTGHADTTTATIYRIEAPGNLVSFYIPEPGKSTINQGGMPEGAHPNDDLSKLLTSVRTLNLLRIQTLCMADHNQAIDKDYHRAIMEILDSTISKHTDDAVGLMALSLRKAHLLQYPDSAARPLPTFGIHLRRSPLFPLLLK